MPTPSVQDEEYAQRLVRLQSAGWKRILDVQAPYRWNLRRQQPGFTLEIGCGIGRNLIHLSGNGVGIDLNLACVRVARARSLEAYTPEEFSASTRAVQGTFDSILLSHVAEHMTSEAVVELLREYLPFLKRGGSVILIAPQERGQASDPTHVEFMDESALDIVAAALGLSKTRAYSFPFPRFVGRFFIYNETVWVGTAP